MTTLTLCVCVARGSGRRLLAFQVSEEEGYMAAKKIAVIVGSLRKESFNRKVAMNLIELAPKELKLEIIEIGHLPMYNQDLDSNPPKEWVELKNRIKSSDGVLFVTPEYNRSVPGVLKNAIDAASRPYGQSAWDGKPAGVVSVSPSAMGAFGANHHLRQSLVFLNMPVMQQPEAYVGDVGSSFDESGKLTARTRGFLENFINAYAAWVDQFHSQSERVSATEEEEATV